MNRYNEPTNVKTSPAKLINHSNTVNQLTPNFLHHTLPSIIRQRMIEWQQIRMHRSEGPEAKHAQGFSVFILMIHRNLQPAHSQNLLSGCFLCATVSRLTQLKASIYEQARRPALSIVTTFLALAILYEDRSTTENLPFFLDQFRDFFPAGFNLHPTLVLVVRKPPSELFTATQKADLLADSIDETFTPRCVLCTIS